MMKIKNAICRFCGLQTKDEVHLFNNKILLERSYSPAEILNIIFKDLEINENDELPKEMCLQCLNNILVSFRFYNLIKKTKDKLIELSVQKKAFSESKYKLILPKTEENLFIDHNIVLHNDKRMYNCYECPEKFRALRQLKKHQGNLHETIDLCNFCNTWYTQNMNLRKHQIEEHQDSKYECLKCKNEKFSSQRRLFNHYNQKHSFKHGYFKCETCQEEFYMRQDLSSHIKKSHTKSIENINDDTKDIKTIKLEFQNHFNDPSEIIENIKNEYPTIKSETNFENKLDEVMDVEFLDEFFLSQHADNSFEFSECWDVLDLSLEDDIKIKMSDFANDIFSESQGHNDSYGKKYQYQCPHCKKGFATQIEVLIHLAHGHNLPVLSCDSCPEKFSNLNDYKMHNIHHLGKNLNNLDETVMEIIKKFDKIIYMCKYCRKKYKEKSNFAFHVCKMRSLKNKHILEQNNSSKFLCDLCQEKFSNIFDMKVHQRTVHSSSNREYECHICKKKFKTNLGFKYHLKTHQGTKSLECPFCDRKFLTKINLNAHIKAIHSIIKNHLCTLCDRNFATLDHLKKHVMSVHQKERSHLCSVCGKLFSQVSHLKSHFKIHSSN